MARVTRLTIKQQSGASGTYYAQWVFSPATTSSTSSNSTSASGGVKTGDIVKIKSGATYYNGVAIPSWVMELQWHVVQVKGDRAVLGKDANGKGYNIQSAINTKYLTGGTGSSSGSSSSSSSSGSDELNHYKVQWAYDTGDSVPWFSAGEETTENNYSTYSGAPANAKRIKVTVTPVSNTYEVNGKETHYWTGESSSATYDLSGDSPETIGTPSVSIDGFTLTAIIDNITSPTTDYVEFQVYDGDKLYSSGRVAVKACRAVYTCNVAAGGSYRVRARALNQVTVNTGQQLNGATIQGIQYKYGPWSDFSGGGGSGGGGLGTVPTAPTGVRAVADSENSIKVTWNASSTADSYEVQYVTNRAYFDAASEVKSATVESNTAYLTGLDGDEWFVRVRAKNSNGNSGWSSIVSAVVGTIPEAPTTWSLTSSVIVGEDITLYWVHNTEDGSKMQGAQIEIKIGDNVTTINKGADANEDKDEIPIHYHVIKTTDYEEGVTILWRVKTKGITGAYGPWSTQRTIKIYAQPTLGLSVSLNEEGVLTGLPIAINAVAGPVPQIPLSYHISIVSLTSYETSDVVGEPIVIPAGTEVYSRVYNSSEYEFNAVVSAGDILIENDQQYNVVVTVSMDSGLTASQSMSFETKWDDYDVYPDASVTIDKDILAAYISPICINQYGGLADRVILSVYRREFNGTFTKIMDGLPNDRSLTLTDPHCSLDYARYRIVAQDIITGSVYYTDLPGIPVGEPSIVIQWDDKWSNFDYTNIEDRFETQPWVGSMLRLPYNIDVTEKTDIDVSLIEYIGRKNPVSYYGTQRGQSANWRTEIPKYDKDTLYAMRRLSDWAGNVYVREPHGTGYWANIKVSWNINHLELIIPINIEVMRVEGDETVTTSNSRGNSYSNNIAIDAYTKAETRILIDDAISRAIGDAIGGSY